MPEFQTFFTAERLAEFWYYVKWLLFFVAPMLMIWVALEASSGMINVIKSAIRKGKNKEDDDYDFYEY